MAVLTDELRQTFAVGTQVIVRMDATFTDVRGQTGVVIGLDTDVTWPIEVAFDDIKNYYDDAGTAQRYSEHFNDVDLDVLVA